VTMQMEPSIQQRYLCPQQALAQRAAHRSLMLLSQIQGGQTAWRWHIWQCLEGGQSPDERSGELAHQRNKCLLRDASHRTGRQIMDRVSRVIPPEMQHIKSGQSVVSS
jgi:hypothetical protein